MKRVGRMIVVAALVVAGALLPTAPAAAHHDLESSSPEAGDHLPAAPEQISLSFAFDVRPDVTTVELVDEDGTDWTGGTLTIDGGDVTVPVAPGVADGNYQVRWRTVSHDGGVVDGTIAFTIGAADPVADPVQTVISSEGAAAIRVGAVALFALIAWGLVTTYGSRRAGRPRARADR